MDSMCTSLVADGCMVFLPNKYSDSGNGLTSTPTPDQPIQARPPAQLQKTPNLCRLGFGVLLAAFG